MERQTNTNHSAISIIVPVYNEEEIISESIDGLIENLRSMFNKFEIIISENGSTDGTREIIAQLVQRHPEVKGLVDPEVADYGLALIEGINTARFDEIAILELDYLDLGFLQRGVEKLREYDLIIGSKKISPGIDQRSFKRKLFTNGYNILLGLFFRLPVTETHGLKVLRKSRIKPLSDECVTRHAVYPSELVIRSCRDADARVCEIPLSLPLVEIRETRIVVGKRLKKTIQDVLLLRSALAEESRGK